MTREEASTLLREKIKNANLIKHCLATEACLGELARLNGENAEIWGLAGLLHDIDYEETSSDTSRHGLVGAAFLESKGLPAEVVHAVQAHSGHVAPNSRLDWALFAADPLTGLIVASALMHPNKKLGSLTVEFVMRRYKEKRFAAGANREQIATCSNLGMELSQFIEVCLRAMTGVSDQLGL